MHKAENILPCLAHLRNTIVCRIWVYLYCTPYLVRAQRYSHRTGSLQSKERFLVRTCTRTDEQVESPRERLAAAYSSALRLRPRRVPQRVQRQSEDAQVFKPNRPSAKRVDRAVMAHNHGHVAWLVQPFYTFLRAIFRVSQASLTSSRMELNGLSGYASVPSQASSQVRLYPT